MATRSHHTEDEAEGKFPRWLGLTGTGQNSSTRHASDSSLPVDSAPMQSKGSQTRNAIITRFHTLRTFQNWKFLAWKPRNASYRAFMDIINSMNLTKFAPFR